MNYELAKELKDAGFPQELKGGLLMTEATKMMPSRLFTSEGIYELPPDYLVYVPTLEELIGACDPYIFDLEFNLHCTHEKGSVGWVACYIPPSDFNEQGRHVSAGKTPSEAAARLWLALNKKEAALE